jgi:UDP-N-acetylglucosamine diphosphorylase/glucosamine-1-phosphate N-acetyltransferase
METFLFSCMDINLVDLSEARNRLKPFTFTRPIAEIRVGILTIREKWEQHGFLCGSISTDHLQKKYPSINTDFHVNASLLPSAELVEVMNGLGNRALIKDGVFLAGIEGAEEMTFKGEVSYIQNTWDIFRLNREQLIADFDLITQGRISQPIDDPHTIVYGEENLFIEKGATIKAAIIDASEGPVYIGKNATVHPGAIINGAFALCEGAHINMGAKIKGDATVGPYCKVGGEVSNSVFFGYSNKGHDGFVGNSVIGEWCNIGADSNTSNLKNNYAEVRLWDYGSGRFANTGLQFCGLMMGDHAKCGINTMFNTGTVVGVGANVFGSGFPRNFIPSFAWGGAAGMTTFQLNKFTEVAQAVMSRRSRSYDQQEIDIIEHVFEQTAQFRIWENK